jgi:tRNA(fMet)-specific endonuclease VapC
MNKSLLDTDILSEVGKAINQTVTRNATAYRQAHGFLTLSVVSVMEVIQGYQRVGATARLQAFRNAIASEEVLVFDQPVADLAGQIAGDLDRVGRPIGRCDPMVAAVAITHGLELVTGNTTHYQRIQQLGYPLTLANWRIRRPARIKQLSKGNVILFHLRYRRRRLNWINTKLFKHFGGRGVWGRGVWGRGVTGDAGSGGRPTPIRLTGRLPSCGPSQTSYARGPLRVPASSRGRGDSDLARPRN